MLVEEAIMGINAPKEHQRVIAKLTIGLGNLYYDGKIALEPLPETMLDEDRTSSTPDITLYDNATEKNKVIIEVCKTSGVENDYLKIKKLVEDYAYGIEEAFVYNYKNGTWRKYTKGGQTFFENPSYCTLIDIDLNGLV